MTYKYSVRQVIADEHVITFETKQLALKEASKINTEGERLAYVKEIKVYGGQAE